MRNLFTPRLNCEPSSVMLSAAVKLTNIPPGAVATISDLDSPGKIFKNGVDAGTSTPVVTGDSIQIQGVASAELATPIFVVFEIAGEPGVFTVVTRTNKTPQQLIGFNGLIPLDLTDMQQSTSADFGSSVSCVNSVYELDGTFMGGHAMPIEMESLGVTGVPFADYYSSSVFFHDENDFRVVGKVTVGMQPYAVCQAAGLTWVTVSTQDRVVVIDEENQLVDVFLTGQRPLGCASYKDADDLWHVLVCNNNSATVTHIKQKVVDGKEWETSTYTVPAKPFEIAIDNSGFAWITTLNNTVTKLRLSDGSLSAFNLGSGNIGPRNVIADPNTNSIIISCPISNRVLVIAATTGIVSAYSTPGGPCGLAVDEVGRVYAACFNSNVIAVIENSRVSRTIAVDPYPYSVRYINGSLLVTNYFGLPSQVTDQVSLGFGINDPLGVPQQTLVSSTPVMISGIDTPTPAAIPNVLGVQLLKNGIGVGTRTTVVNGDKLSMQLITPHVESFGIDIPLFVGNTWDSYKTITTNEDVVPDFETFVFEWLHEQPLNTVLRSNTYTLTGIDEKVELIVTLSAGELVINGENIHDVTAVVKPNDTIAIEMRTGFEKNDVQSFTITLAGNEQEWRVYTLVKHTYWLKDEHKTTGLHDVEFTPSYTNQLVRMSNLGLAVTGRIDLTATPTGEAIRNKNYLNVLDYLGDRVIRLDAADGRVAEVIQLPAGARPIAMCTAPKLSKIPNLLATPLVACAGLNAVYNVISQELKELPGKPAGMIAPDDGAFVYVAIPEMEAVVVLNGTTFDVINTLSFSNRGQPAELVMWGKHLLVACRDHNLVRLVAGGSSVTQTTFEAGNNIWDMFVEGNILYTANAWDNTISRFTLVNNGKANKGTLTRVGSVPLGFASSVDNPKDGGRLAYVAHLAQGEITDDQGKEIVDVQQTISGIMRTDKGTFGVSLYGNQAFGEGNPDLLIMDGPMDTIVWDEMLDQKKGSTIRSNKAVISGVAREVKLTAKMSLQYRFYLNDKLVGYTFYVKNGDTLQIEYDLPNLFNTDVYVSIASYNVTSTFHAKTEPIRRINPVTFDDIWDVRPRDVLTSSEALVSGLTEGAESPLQVLSGTWVEWTLYVNDVLQPNTVHIVPENNAQMPHIVMVKNGDRIRLHGTSRSSFGETIVYTLLSDGEPVGTLTTHDVKFDGLDERHWVYREQNVSVPRVQAVASTTSALRTCQNRVAVNMPHRHVVESDIKVTKTYVIPKQALRTAQAPKAVAMPHRHVVETDVAPYKAVAAVGRKVVEAENVISAVANAHYSLRTASRATAARNMTRKFSTWTRPTSAPNVHYAQRTAKTQASRNVNYTQRTAKVRDTRRNATYDVRKPEHVRWLRNAAQVRKYSEPTQWIRNALYERRVAADVWIRPALHTQVLAKQPEWIRREVHAQCTTESKAIRNSFTEQRTASRPAIRNVYTDQRSSSRMAVRNTNTMREGVKTRTERNNQYAQRLANRPAAIRNNHYALRTVVRPSVIDIPALDPSFKKTTYAIDQGLYFTAEEAIDAARWMNFQDVWAVKVGIYWTWACPPKRQNADCAIIADKLVMPSKWYVHGG